MMAPSGNKPSREAAALVLRNAFNGETFIFPAADDPKVASFVCALEPGGSGGANALMHVHPRANETFRVKSGCLRVHVNGAEHLVPAGSSITIRAGEKHRFHNGVSAPSVFDVEFSSAQRHLEFFKTFGSLTERRPQWFSAHGKPDFLLVALMLHRYRDHLYLASAPIWAQKLLFALATPLALLLGYRLKVTA